MRADTIARLGDFEFLLSQGVAPLDAARRCGWKSWKSFQKCALRAGRKLPVCKNGHLREEWGCLTTCCLCPRSPQDPYQCQGATK